VPQLNTLRRRRGPRQRFCLCLVHVCRPCPIRAGPCVHSGGLARVSAGAGNG
jgi:hypothetical protein